MGPSPQEIIPQADTVSSLFGKAVDLWPDRVAFRVNRGGRWDPKTFADVGEDVRACSGGLIDLGFPAGEFAAVVSGNRPEWHEAYFGAVSAGMVATSADPASSPAQVHQVLGHCDAGVVFVEDEAQRAKVDRVREHLPELRLCVVFTGEGCDGRFYVSWAELLQRGLAYLVAQPGEYELRRSAARGEDLAAVVYAGVPLRGVMLSHRNIVWTLASLDSALAGGPDDRRLSYLPLSGVREQTWTALLQLHQGFEVWFARSPGAVGAVLEDLAACRPTLQLTDPTVLRQQRDQVTALLEGLSGDKRSETLGALELARRRVRLLQEGETPPSEIEQAWRRADTELFAMIRDALGYDEVRALVTGVEATGPMPQDLLEFFHAIGVPLLEVYGPAEATGWATANRIAEARPGTVGRPLPGVEVAVTADREVLVRGGNVCLGHYRDPGETRAHVDEDGWLHTGDHGVLDAGGVLHLAAHGTAV